MCLFVVCILKMLATSKTELLDDAKVLAEQRDISALAELSNIQVRFIRCIANSLHIISSFIDCIFTNFHSLFFFTN
jgi:hypothetical protein